MPAVARARKGARVTRRMVAPILVGFLGVAVLVALGVWQLQRLDWKRGVLAELEVRLAAAPVPVPDHPDPVADRYLRVRAEGALLPGEIHVYAAGPGGKVGYRVVAPFELPDGRRILLDRGFVPVADKDAPRPPGPLAVTGNLVWPDDGPPDPDRAKNVWTGRDVPLMAADLGTAPVLVVAAAVEPAGGPVPLPVSVAIPNDHLGYAMTWFGLAAVWTLMTVLWLSRIKRGIV